MWHSEKTVEQSKIPTPHLVKDKTDAGCTVCHTMERSEFMKPYRHKLILSGNTCVSCHDPHLSKKELRSMRTIFRKCIDCHPETGGPFIYVHLGTQHEGCMECHVPHGSPNPNLLTRHEPRMLCLSCHANTPQFHNQANPKYRDCTACHPAIHGSNMSKSFMR
jgi:DmsE family decaheme c-type cytochrome